MRRLLVLSVLLYIVILLALTFLLSEMLALVLPLAAYLAAALLFSPGEPQLEVTRNLAVDRISQGEPAQVTLTVTNKGGGLEEVLIEDAVPRPLEVVEGQAHFMGTLPAGATVEWSYTLSGKRGYHRFGDVQVTARNHLGLIRRRATLQVPDRLFVLPQVLRLRRLVIRPQRTRAYAGLIPARQGGPGVEFYGVREYQPGDPLRWINWQVSARRTQELYVNEFEQERVADVGLILDARQRSYIESEEVSLFEYAVQATAALAEAFLQDSNRVGLLLYGNFLDWTFPGYGKIQRERLLRSLARAELGESLLFDRLEHLPTRLFPAQSQIVLVSPLAGDDLPTLIHMRARGYQLLVISPDPVSFEARMLQGQPGVEQAERIARVERSLLLRRLRQTGAYVLDWDVALPFDHAIHAAFGRQPLWFRTVRVGPKL